MGKGGVKTARGIEARFEADVENALIRLFEKLFGVLHPKKKFLTVKRSAVKLLADTIDLPGTEKDLFRKFLRGNIRGVMIEERVADDVFDVFIFDGPLFFGER